MNRTMFILGGYIFDKRLRYSSTVWTSAGAASIVVAGNIGWQFNKALTLTGGYTGVPGSRSLVNTFPFFTATDRSMADNFFRPGFTQGVWANGETSQGAELLGVRRQRSQYSEYLGKQDRYESDVFRQCLVGTAGRLRRSPANHATCTTTISPRKRLAFGLELRLPDPGRTVFQISINRVPRTLSMYNSDGVLAFSTGAFAPGVTVEKATYKMWAIDGGIKWNGLAINGQYFFPLGRRFRC